MTVFMIHSASIVFACLLAHVPKLAKSLRHVRFAHRLTGKSNSHPRSAVVFHSRPRTETPCERLRKVGLTSSTEISTVDAWQAEMMCGRSTVRKAIWQRFPDRIVSSLVLAAIVVTGAGNAPCSIHAQETSKLDAWCGFLNGGSPLKGASLPLQWSADGPAIAWQAAIEGYGQSSPVLYGPHVFLTSTSGENKEKLHLAAYLLESGEKIWGVDFENPSPEENNRYVSRAAPTPVVDKDGLYVVYEGGFLASMAFDGSVRWQRNLVQDYGAIKARHGLASSLEQSDSLIYVWVERMEDPYLMAVEKKTGKTVWKVPGLGSTTWSSPRLVPVGETEQLVCSAGGKLAGFNSETGEKLWELIDISNNTSCTPVPVADGQFVIGASNGRGEEPAEERILSNGLVQITPKPDGKFMADFVWRAEKATSSFGSPLVAQNKVWLVNRTGALYQLDLKTGEQLAVSRIEAGSIWATPLATSDKAYFFGQKGTTSVVSLDRGEELATNTLWDESVDENGGNAMSAGIQYAAAASGDRLLIRRGERLYCLYSPADSSKK